MAQLNLALHHVEIPRDQFFDVDNE